MLLALAKRLPQIKILDTKFLAGSENKVVFSVYKYLQKHQNQANSHQM